MNALRSWLKDRGFRLYVKPGVGDEVITSPTRVVFVDSNANPQERLATLMHECGHVAVLLCRKPRPKIRVAGASLEEMDREKGRWRPRTTRKVLAELHEEFEAWERGQSLARRLRVRYSHVVFERVRAKCLMSYVRGGVRRRLKAGSAASAQK